MHVTGAARPGASHWGHKDNVKNIPDLGFGEQEQVGSQADTERAGNGSLWDTADISMTGTY